MTAMIDKQLAGEPRHWLVTGAAGFIGSHLVETLLNNGQFVVGMDNFSTGFRSNVDQVSAWVGAAAAQRWTFIEGDIRSYEGCVKACQGMDFVLHQAALGSVPRSIKNPLATHQSNVDGMVNMLLAAKEAAVKRVVYASSSSVYGDSPALPKHEEVIGEPLSPYALSKRTMENYSRIYASTLGIDSVGLRYFNVVGSRQSPDGPYAAVIPRWIEAFSRGNVPVINGDGETSRDFCPVQNVVQANIRAALCAGNVAGQVYNIALGGRTTLNTLYKLLRDGMAERGAPCAETEPRYADFRPGDIRHSHASIARAQRDFGYDPQVTLGQALGMTMDEYLASHGKSSSGIDEA